jgi:hypothetical protein
LLGQKIQGPKFLFCTRLTHCALGSSWNWRLLSVGQRTEKTHTPNICKITMTKNGYLLYKTELVLGCHTENFHYNFEFSVVLSFRLGQVFAKAQKDPVTYNTTQ